MVKWTEQMILEEASKYGTRKEFQVQSNAAYKAAYRRKIMDIVCAHMAQPRDKPFTEQEMHEEALKYTTRTDFQKKAGAAYQAAYKKGILDQVCSHMRVSVTASYTYDELKKEALKYNSRVDFVNGSHSAYIVSHKRGILEEICSHMKSSRGTSIPEKMLFDIIKLKYPNVKKIRNNGININNKPYIKAFDIDIYIPELNKGIEFDGKYYHTFEFMRKDIKKSKWSDEDILKYHEIKDEYFISKGIYILHIKEEDWIKDKQECINKCITFLEQK